MIDYARYLLAKRRLDDRSLNHQVWLALDSYLRGSSGCQILELGAGVGTMVERLQAAGLLTRADYTLLDGDGELLRLARERLGTDQQGTRLHYVATAFQDFLRQAPGKYDLIVAHSFLDLIDLPLLLPPLLALLKPGAGFYFTLNFDGGTILQPPVQPGLDEKIERLYHQTMDERLFQGAPAGDSQTGRHLPELLRQSGAAVTAAGSSDWVVLAGPDGYPDDEAYFLACILDTMEMALRDRPELGVTEFADWLGRRRQQLASGELFYVAHQLDYFGYRLKQDPQKV